MPDRKQPPTRSASTRGAGSRRTRKPAARNAASAASATGVATAAPTGETKSPRRRTGAIGRAGRMETLANAARPRSVTRPPTVVIFGAGITGLTAAHELIERGFHVQVVERTRSPEIEYGVEVGGIAANQQGVIKADLPRLHPYLFPGEDDGYCRAVQGGDIEDQGAADFLDEIPAQPDERESPEIRERRDRYVDLALKVRATPLARSRHRVNLTETLQFRTLTHSLGLPGEEIKRLVAFLAAGDADAAVVKEFRAFADDRGITNDEKLHAIAMKIARALINRTARFASDLDMAFQFSSDNLRETLAAEYENSKLMEIFFRREVLVVEVRGNSNPDLDGTTARGLGLVRAKFVRKLLLAKLHDLFLEDDQFYRLHASLSKLFEVPFEKWRYRTRELVNQFDHHLVAVSRAAAFPIGRHRDDRRRSDRVDFLVVEVPLPGEHGYRYFPAYYRHLFDTMRRTPILDANGDETSECTFDQLVTPPSVSLSLEGRRDALPIARKQFRSIEDLRAAASTLLDGVGLESRDLQIFMLRIFTFISACKDRRRLWQDQSWMEFLHGKTALSDKFSQFHQDTALALLSMDADEADAYSYALNAVQLLLDYRGDGGGVDMTLNGPTSETWLRPWKQYLVRQGVEFFQGELIDLIHIEETGEVVPLAIWHDDPPRIKDENNSEAQRAEELRRRAEELRERIPEQAPEKRLHLQPLPERVGAYYAGYTEGRGTPYGTEAMADFYILALPFEQAGRITRSFDSRHPGILGGDLARLVAFDRHCIPRDKVGNDLVQCVPSDPVRGSLRDADGKPNHPGYPLRDLSGIQFFFPNNVQIGRGHVIHGDSEWGLTSIAQATHWRTRLSRREGYLGQLSVDIGNFYRTHQIVFESAETNYLGHKDAPYKDDLRKAKTAWRCPYWEIPLRVWDQILESDEMAVDPPTYYHMDDGILLLEGKGNDSQVYPAENRTPFLINLPGQWQLRPGYGPVLDASGAAASTHSDTDIHYEISNDRWVLAGTYMATHTRLMTMEACNESARHAVNAILDAIRQDVPNPGAEPKYSSHGKQLGRRCEIFDPYNYEIADLRTFKELDKALCDEGLPHFVEILGIDRLVESMPRGAGSEATQLSKLFDAARTVHRTQGKIPGLPTLPDDFIVAQIHKGLDTLSEIPGLDGVVKKIKELIG